jgi:GxxExxY protein
MEKVYERALLRELTLRGLCAKPQASFKVTYKGGVVGDYFADILVNFQNSKVDDWKRIVNGFEA